MKELRTFGRVCRFLRKRQAKALNRNWRGYGTEVMHSIFENGAKRRLEQVRLPEESGCAASKSIELLRLIRITWNS